MLDLVSNGRYAILGSSGTGKSNLTWLLLEALRKNRQPVAIIDHKGEYSDLPDVVIVDPRKISGPDLANRLRSSNASVVVNVNTLKKPQIWVRDFINSCLRVPRQIPILVVIEECHNYCPQQGKAESKRAVSRLLAEGRSLGYGSLMISQRCAKLDKNALAECEYLYLLRHHLPRDIQYLEDFIGPERASTIQYLKTGEIIVMDQPNHKFYEPEIVPEAIRKKRGHTPKAKGVDPDLDKLASQVPKPYSKIKAQAEYDEGQAVGKYGMVAVAVVVIIIVIAVVIYFKMRKENEVQTEAYNWRETPE